MNDKFDVSGYLSVFIDEVDEQLQVLSKEILAMEKDGEDKETIQKIFRAAHTLKGSSGAMGFDKMQELTHSMENVLDCIRKGGIRASSYIVTLLLECHDVLRKQKEAIQKGMNDDADISGLLEKLSMVVSGEDRREIESAEVRQFVLSLDEYSKQVLKEGIAQGLKALAVYVRCVSQCQMKSVRAYLVTNNLKDIGEIVATIPAPEDLESERVGDSFLYVILTAESGTKVIDAVNSVSEIAAVSTREIMVEDIMSGDEGRVCEFDFEMQKSGCPSAGQEDKRENGQKQAKILRVVRVDVEKIERLMNLIGELVINQTRVLQLGNGLRVQFKGNSALDALIEVSQHTGRIVASLQEGVMKARMVPIEQLFSRFPRMVRDLSMSSGKKVNFIAEGGETELDRTIVEEISDPLIHLLRNAIDHGIEEPALRAAAGKAEEGTVRISAKHRDNMIEIIVSDDGGGIDPAVIRERAVEKGFIKKEETGNISDTEAVNLIFTPGFSTSDTVNEVSGRGVGMDIVRNNIENANGILDIETKVGEGTRFIIKLPLTLAIIPSLLVRINEATLAVPLSNVVEIVRAGGNEVYSLNKHEAMVVRDKVLPLVRIHEKFPGQRQEPGKNIFVVIVGSAEKRIGLVVDKLLGNQEVVIKPLGKYIGKVKGISGATILGDGKIALILDAGYLAKQAADRL